MTRQKLILQLEETIDITRHIQEQMGQVEAIARLIIECFRHEGRLLLCGNGGSASQAQHFATELTGRYRHNRDPLPALALNADGSLLTCIGNDFQFDDIFARQVHAFGHPGDILIGLSTSGRSRNVLHALSAARAKGMTTIGLTGAVEPTEGSKANEAPQTTIAQLCDHMIGLPSRDTARIQEGHLMIIHLICDQIEAVYANEPGS